MLIFMFLFSNLIPNYLKYTFKISIISFSMLGFYLLNRFKKKAAEKYNVSTNFINILNFFSHLLPLILVNFIYTEKLDVYYLKMKGLFIYSIIVLIYLSLANPMFAYDYVDMNPFRMIMLGSGIFNILFSLFNY